MSIMKIDRCFNIIIDDEKKFLKDLNSNKPFIDISDVNIWELGFNSLPYSDIEEPENFPNCCDYHLGIFNEITNWFETFPNCCDSHRKIIGKKWFIKENYNHVPLKVTRQVMFSSNFISLNINSKNWFSDITDYIDYNIESFGTPEVGASQYIILLSSWVSTLNLDDLEFAEWKRNQISEYLENLSKPPKVIKTDFNLLYSTFQKWIKTFPDLGFFNNLKKEFEGKFPIQILLYEPKLNRYTGITKFKLRTRSELIEILINSTKNLLGSINTPLLLRNNLISNKEKYQLDILNEQHILTQNHLLIEYSSTEIKYLKVIKKWLKNEKIYLEKLKDLTQNIHTMPKLFIIEKRKNFGKEYLKVFLRQKDDIAEVAVFIKNLQSVKAANVTENKEVDITVYPAKTYSVDETADEINVSLDIYFNKGKYDPVFEDKIELLSSNSFDIIINHIYNFGRNLEKYKGLYDKFDEEGFRDFFLPHLNSISTKHTATGETFNKIGKTDILIQDEKGLNVFIAECKLWKGESEQLKAIDQLLDRYVTWRDEKVALIIFNKENKNFTELLSKAVDGLKKHSLFDAYIGKSKDTSYRFVFKHPDDPNRKITLELIIFNCV